MDQRDGCEGGKTEGRKGWGKAKWRGMELVYIGKKEKEGIGRIKN